MNISQRIAKITRAADRAVAAAAKYPELADDIARELTAELGPELAGLSAADIAAELTRPELAADYINADSVETETVELNAWLLQLQQQAGPARPLTLERALADIADDETLDWTQFSC